MNAESIYHRQIDIVPLDRLQKAQVTVIGAGAVGSFTGLTLAKMGVGKIIVYDDDTVTEHNLPNQLFRVGDIGQPKVRALADIVREFHGVAIDARNEKYATQALIGIVVVAVDSMDARLKIWDQVRYNSRIELFIDSRMGAEVGRVITIRPADPDDVTAYESTLYTSAEALQARCTERAVIYTVLGIASAICGRVANHLRGDPYDTDVALDFKLGRIQPLLSR